MVVLRRVRVHKFRNVVPGCEFELMPGINVLLGQNGTGKTTLLIWLTDMLAGRWHKWEQESYDVELALQSADVQATFRVRNTPPRLPKRSGREAERTRGLDRSLPGGELETKTVAIDIGLQTPDNHYEIEWRPPTLSFKYGDSVRTEEHPGLEEETIMGILSYFEEMPNVIGRQYYEPRDEEFIVVFLDRLVELFDLSRFDESLGLFTKMLGKESPSRLVLSSTPRYDTEGMEWGCSGTSLIPAVLSRLAEDRVESLSSIDDLTTLTFKGREIPFLGKAVEILGFHSAELHCMRLKKDSYPVGTSSVFGEFWITFTRHDRSSFHHDRLSYGQKRMLAFLWYLEVNKQVIVIDELVNGLHHAWIEYAIEMLEDRQAILTSQNPLLLDYLAFESADEVRRRFILCRTTIDPETRRERWIWRNPNEREADSFYSAYRAGIQHVGEILMDKGLW